jgi:hypothetical protein
MRSSLAVLAPVVALLAVTAPAWAGSKLPTVTVSYDGGTRTITTTVDRKATEIAGIECTFKDIPVSCGDFIFPAAKKSTTLETSVGCTTGGTFVATATLTKGGSASGSAEIPGSNISACSVVSPGSVFPAGANM